MADNKKTGSIQRLRRLWRQNKLTLAAMGSLLVFLLALAEGIAFHSLYTVPADLAAGERLTLSFMLALENAIKAFQFKASLSMQTVIGRLASMPPQLALLSILYILTVFIAPLCALTVVYQTVRTFAAPHVERFWMLFHHQDRILILGSGKDVSSLLKTQKNDPEMANMPVVLLTRQELNADQKKALDRKGILFRSLQKFSALEDKGDRNERLFRYLGLDKVSHIFLMEEHAADNFAGYILLADCLRSADTRPDKQRYLYCSCGNPEVERLICRYHDEHLTANLRLKLFSVTGLKTEEIFAADKTDLFAWNKAGGFAARDIHMLIVGFASMGQAILRRALDLAVLSSNSRIVFDIVDRDPVHAGRLLGNMFTDAYDPDARQVRLDGSAPDGTGLDGTLLIRLHEQDCADRAFTRLLGQITQTSPLTYAAICLSDLDDSIHCMTELEEFVDQDTDCAVPILVRMEAGEVITAYLDQNTAFHNHISIFAAGRDVISFRRIMDSREAKQAEDIHAAYAAGEAARTGKDVSADQLRALFRTDSSLHQVYHLPTKALFLDHCPVSREELRERAMAVYSTPAHRAPAALTADPILTEMAAMEHRRWCYYMISNGWRYTDEARTSENRVWQESHHVNHNLLDWDTLVQLCPDVLIYDLDAWDSLLGITQEDKKRAQKSAKGE